jgi:hypothetical protein
MKPLYEHGSPSGRHVSVPTRHLSPGFLSAAKVFVVDKASRRAKKTTAVIFRNMILE